MDVVHGISAAYLTAHTHLDLAGLSHIRTYDDLLQAVAHTPYRKLLEGFRPAPGTFMVPFTLLPQVWMRPSEVTAAALSSERSKSTTSPWISSRRGLAGAFGLVVLADGFP